jgi:hypothetical protein
MTDILITIIAAVVIVPFMIGARTNADRYQQEAKKEEEQGSSSNP